VIEEQPVKNTRTKKFRLKVIPKQHKTEYFDAFFLFDGEKAPSMSVVSLSAGVSIGASPQWKIMVKIIAFFVFIILLVIGLAILFDRLGRQKQLGRFRQYATELREKGKLQSTDEQAINDAVTIYDSYTRLTLPKFWAKRPS
jgi:hypothetical protein